MKNITEKTAQELNHILDEIKTEDDIRATEPYIYIDPNGVCKINSKINGVDTDEIIVADGFEEIWNMVDNMPFNISELIDYLDARETNIEDDDEVENFLRSIGEFENSRGETYEETAQRLRENGMPDEADQMLEYAKQWYE
jgi:hypothetical protein